MKTKEKLKLYTSDIEYILELVKRGFSMPIKVDEYPVQTFMNYHKETKEFSLYNKRIGCLSITQKVLEDNLLNGTYELGHLQATDKIGTPLKVGDKVIIGNLIGTVTKIIIDPIDLIKKKTGSKEFKHFYKYSHILKPIIFIQGTHKISTGALTQIPETFELYECKTIEAECFDVLVLNKS